MRTTTLPLAALLLFSFCTGEKKAGSEALAKYATALEKLRKTDLEENAVSAFQAVSGKNNIGDKALFQALERCTLPGYSLFYQKLREIRPEDTTLSNLHFSYREGVRFQLLAFSNVSRYLVSKDSEDLRRFREQSTHARNLIDRWKKEFSSLITAAGKQ